jgi:hypothetical protein
MKCDEVHLSRWLADDTMMSGWYGDSNENDNMYGEVAQRFKRDDGEAVSCPLNFDNMDLTRP